MEYKFKITTGDPTRDGHSQTDDFFFISNYSVKEIEKAYKQSCTATGIDISSCCSDYEDSSIDEDILASLREAGIPDDVIDNVSTYVGVSEFVILVLEFIKLSMPIDFKYEITNDNIPSLNIDLGYGLYH